MGREKGEGEGKKGVRNGEGEGRKGREKGETGEGKGRKGPPCTPDTNPSPSHVYFSLTIHIFYSTDPPLLHLYIEPRLMSSTAVKTYRQKVMKESFTHKPRIFTGDI